MGDSIREKQGELGVTVIIQVLPKFPTEERERESKEVKAKMERPVAYCEVKKSSHVRDSETPGDIWGVTQIAMSIDNSLRIILSYVEIQLFLSSKKY